MKATFSFWKKLSDPRLTAIPALVVPAHLPSLDGLRAISILIVIVSHVFIQSDHYYLRNGQSGVHIFFVISGFLITTLLLKEKVSSGDISLQKFYARRALRIFPVAYLYLFTLILLNFIFQLNITTTSFAMAFLYIKNLTFLNTSEWQTGHFWSLAIEEQFYLLFPLILKYNYKLYVRLIVLLILLIPVANIAGILSGRLSIHGWQYTALVYLIAILGKGTTSILWGSLCSILLFKGMIPGAFLERFKGAALYLLLLLLLMDTRGILDFPGKEVINLYLFAPGLCIVILLGLYKDRSLSFFFLNNTLIRKIGVLSYSIYVWQQLFTSHQPWANAFRYGAAVWFNLPVLAVVAYLSYHLFEKKFLRLKDRYMAKSGSVREQASQRQAVPAQDPAPGHHSIAL